MRNRLEEQQSDIARSTWWVGGWITPIIVVAFTVLWVLLHYWLIGDRSASRTWQYGTPPYVPGESIATVKPPTAGQPGNQVVLPMLPPRGGANASR